MATTLELPTKRASEVMGSGSGLDLEASKKPKLESLFFNLHSLDELGRLYDDRNSNIEDDPLNEWNSIEDPLNEWRRYVKELDERCKIREIQYFLISKGHDEDEAKKIQSLEDKLARSINSRCEFTKKGWILRTDPGPYNDYQRLYVGHIIYCGGELAGKYCHFYFSYRRDLALQKFFKELQSSITWDSSPSVAQRIVEDASTEYKDLQLFILEQAVQETITQKACEQRMKERVPLFTKLWQEVVTKKRDATEVLIEIKEKDAASFPSSQIIIEDDLRRKADGGSVRLINIFGDMKTYINAATKGEYSDEELIRRYFSQLGPFFPVVYTYGDYLEKKMQIAAKLGLIKNESSQ